MRSTLAFLVFILPTLAHGQILLTSSQRSASVSVSNDGRSSTSYTVAVQSWTHDEAGRMQLRPTHDLVVSPEQFSLASGERTSLTVSVESGLDEKEHSYFIVVARPGGEQHIAVFAQNRRGRSQVWLNDATLDNGEISVTFANHGDAHDEIQTATVTLLSSSGEKLYTAEQLVGVILAGASRKLAFPSAPDCRGCKLTVAARVGADMLNASFTP